MTERDELPGLHDLLERATDRLPTPDLAHRALILAGRRRRVRAGVAVAAAVAVVAIGGVVVATEQSPDSAPPTTPATPQSTPPTEPTQTEPSPTEPAIDPALVQDRWDPRDVDQLPVDSDVVPDLPDVVAPPVDAAALSESPLTDAAILAVHRETAVKVLSAAGEWRMVAIPADEPSTMALSPGGQQLAIRYDGRTEVWSVLTGEMQAIKDPKGFNDTDYPGVRWLDESYLLLRDLEGGWYVDVETEHAERAPYPRDDGYHSTVDPTGVVIEARGFEQPAAIDIWASEPRVIPTPDIGHLFRIAASGRLIAGAAYDGPAIESFAAFVLDRETGEPQAVLPMRDFEGNYSNWGLGVESVRSDGSVLLMVAAIGKDGMEGWRLVRWEPGSGRLAIVSRIDVNLPEWVTFARDALL